MNRLLTWLIVVVAVGVAAQLSTAQFFPGNPGGSPGGPGGPGIQFNPTNGFYTNGAQQISLSGSTGGGNNFNPGQFNTNANGQVSQKIGANTTNDNAFGESFPATNRINFPAFGEEIGDDGSGNLAIFNPSGVVNIGGSAFGALDGTLQANLFNGAIPVTDLDNGTGSSDQTYWRGNGKWSFLLSESDLSTNQIVTNGIIVTAGASLNPVFIGADGIGDVSLLPPSGAVSIDQAVPGDGGGTLIAGLITFVTAIESEATGYPGFFVWGSANQNFSIGLGNTGGFLSVDSVGEGDNLGTITGWAWGSFASNVLTASLPATWHGQMSTLNAGFTNNTGSNCVININGSVGYFVFYKNSGLPSSPAVAANPLFTNALSTNGWSRTLQPNCGVQVLAGVGQANVTVDW